MKLRFQRNNVSFKGNGGVSMYSHGLGCHNLMARIMGRVACRADRIGTGIGKEGVCAVYTCCIAG